jgi:hypothetical protein
LVAMDDISDSDIRDVWDWVGRLPGAEFSQFVFLHAILTAAHHRKLRQSVGGHRKGEFDAFPSRLVRVVGRHRKSGAQTDFLRMLGITLSDLDFNIDAPGAQTIVMKVAQKILGDQGVGLTPNTVSTVWQEIRNEPKLPS